MSLTKRILAIDFARAISVFFLIIVHTMLIYGTIETQTQTVFGNIVLWLGRGAAMYLIAMGISFTFSRRQSFYSVIKRGFYIVFIGYSLNFLKFIVPEFVFGGLPNRFLEAYHLESQTLETSLFFLGLGDILQLAGFSLFLIAFINLISENKWLHFSIGIIIILLAKELNGFRIDIPIINYICDLFFSSQYNVYFPVFPWSAFILIGVFLGKLLKEKNNKDTLFFKSILLQSLGLIVLGLLLVITNYNYHFGDYYHLGPGGSIVLLGIMMFAFWISNQLLLQLKPSPKAIALVTYLSKNITSIYCIQWVLINWGMYVFGFWELGQISVLLLIPLYTVLTLLINYSFRSLQKIKTESFQSKKQPISM